MSTSILPIRLINLKGNGLHLLIQVRINKRKAVLVLDTGASKTVIDTTRAVHFFKHGEMKKDDRTSSGLGTNSMESFHGRLDEFQLGDFLLKDYHATLLDLSHVNMAYANLGLKPVDGVLGSDLLDEFTAVIDYGKRILLLRKTVSKPKAKKAASKKSSAPKKIAKKKTAKRPAQKSTRRKS